ncbi:MerR family transcriptional regulator [Ruania halotolerans]|uniref:MerR family transcriptional regulator n=1 Tax=Ruania halotolerans TaxID=2897773 RepID=UPI001E449DFA|nr:MerR family transcriptional regulator [Ruania halotolerans]UFU07538.1 MerR family transcriptional regulator [Ruania halotolerans]
MAGAQGTQQMQIGAVAEATGLSLRTIRYYEEVGLLTPTARSAGGFRLYTEADVERLRVVTGMKPLDFTLEEMRELLDVRETLGRTDLSAQDRTVALDRLAHYESATEERCNRLRRRLRTAESFIQSLREERAASAAPSS